MGKAARGAKGGLDMRITALLMDLSGIAVSLPPSRRDDLAASLLDVVKAFGPEVRKPVTAKYFPPASRNPSASRPLWKDRSGEDKTLDAPAFIARHYAPEIAAGSLSQAILTLDDFELMVALRNWRNYRKRTGQPADLPFPFPRGSPRERRYAARYGAEARSLLAAQRKLDRDRKRGLA